MQITLTPNPRSDRPGGDVIQIFDSHEGKIAFHRSEIKGLLRCLLPLQLGVEGFAVVRKLTGITPLRREIKSICQKNVGKPKSAE